MANESIYSLWSVFNAQFPSERDCLEELYRMAQIEGFLKCHYCAKCDVQREYGARVITCMSCRKKSWITSGTFFERIKSARPWLAAIWLMERGVMLSSSRFHKLVGIAQSTALNIFKKITTVIDDENRDTVLTLPSALFAPTFCKRSRETPARCHPVAEQAEMERETGDCDVLHDQEESVPELSPFEQEIYDHLGEDPLAIDSIQRLTRLSISDLLSGLAVLEISGLADRQAGNRYIRVSQYPATRGGTASLSRGAAQSAADASIDFVRKRFHGISRKYLQNYLSAHWCSILKKRRPYGWLLRWCLKFGPLTGTQILQYVSPLLVKAPLSP